MEQQTVKVLEDFWGYSEEKICFRTGAKPEVVYDTTKWAFEHKGPEYDLWSPSSIRMFQERILLGQHETPSVMVVNHDHTCEVASAALIYEQPNMLLDTEFNAFLRSVDVLSRYGAAFLAHTPLEHMTLMRGFEHIVPGANNSIRRGMDLLLNYFENGQLPDVPPPPSGEILREDEFFVVIEGPPGAWQKQWAEGRLYGIRFGDDEVEILKKSSFVPYVNLYEVIDKLNKQEGKDLWKTEGSIARAEQTSLDRQEIIDAVESMRRDR